MSARHRHARTVRSALAPTRDLLRAIAGVWRFDPDPSSAADPRAERLAAWGIGVIVLGGAIGTYLVVVGGISPLLAEEPAGGQPPARVSTAAATTAGSQRSTAPPAPAPSATAAPSPTRTARPTRRSTTLADATVPPASTQVQTTTTAPPETTSDPAPSTPPPTSSDPG
jgi:hypothetical protein